MGDSRSIYTGFDLSAGHRVLTALKWGLLVVVLIPFGVGATALLTAFICGAMGYELLRITTRGAAFDEPVVGIAIAVAALPAFITYAGGVSAGIVVGLLGAAFLLNIIPTKDDRLTDTAPAIAAIGLAGAMFVALRAMPDHGLATALLLMAIVWGTELGRHFLGPVFQPDGDGGSLGIGGVLGAIAGGLLAGGIVAAVYRHGHVAQVMVLSAVTALVCTAFDQIEPWLRRKYDASALPPLPLGLHTLLDQFGGLVGASLLIGGVLMAAGSPFGW